MTRALLPAAACCWLLCLSLILGAGLTGRFIPSEPLAVAISYLAPGDYQLTRLDSTLHPLDHRRIITDLLRQPDNRCRLFYTPPAAAPYRLVMLNLFTGQQRPYLPVSGSITGLDWLPDNRRLWVSLDDIQGIPQYLILDTITGTALPVIMPPVNNDAERAVLWAPDSAQGVFYLPGSVAFTGIITTATGVVTPLPVQSRVLFAWSPDSRLLAMQEVALHRVTVLDTTGVVRYRHKFPTVLANLGPFWLSDTTLLVGGRTTALTPEFTVYRWTLPDDTLEMLPVRLQLPSLVSSFRTGWSPDGTRLSFSGDGETRLYDLATGTVLMHNTFAWEHINWSPDSRYMVQYPSNSSANRTGDEGFFLISDTVSKATARFPGGVARLEGQWSPDSRLLAVSGQGTSVAVVTFGPDGTPHMQNYPLDPAAYRINFCFDEVPA